MKSLARGSVLLLATLLAAPAAACGVDYAAVVDIDACGTATLPDFSVQFTGITGPETNLPLSCWNYTITARASGSHIDLRNCHTGELGGEQEFLLDDKPFVFVHGVAAGCVRLANGNYTHKTQGHAFVPGRRDSTALANFHKRQSRQSAHCLQQARDAAGR